jgi:hypothetical protein
MTFPPRHRHRQIRLAYQLFLVRLLLWDLV